MFFRTHIVSLLACFFIANVAYSDTYVCNATPDRLRIAYGKKYLRYYQDYKHSMGWYTLKSMSCSRMDRSSGETLFLRAEVRMPSHVYSLQSRSPEAESFCIKPSWFHYDQIQCGFEEIHSDAAKCQRFGGQIGPFLELEMPFEHSVAYVSRGQAKGTFRITIRATQGIIGDPFEFITPKTPLNSPSAKHSGPPSLAPPPVSMEPMESSQTEDPEVGELEVILEY